MQKQVTIVAKVKYRLDKKSAFEVKPQSQSITGQKTMRLLV